MARRSLVIDASVAVKWFSADGEKDVAQAVDIMDRHANGELQVVVPALLYYEMANALVHKTPLTDEKVQISLSSAFSLGLKAVATDEELMGLSIRLARQAKITVYDAYYAAVAHKYKCPLVTANPRHQAQVLNCEVIPLENWRW